MKIYDRVSGMISMAGESLSLVYNSFKNSYGMIKEEQRREKLFEARINGAQTFEEIENYVFGGRPKIL